MNEGSPSLTRLASSEGSDRLAARRKLPRGPSAPAVLGPHLNRLNFSSPEEQCIVHMKELLRISEEQKGWQKLSSPKFDHKVISAFKLDVASFSVRATTCLTIKDDKSSNRQAWSDVYKFLSSFDFALLKNDKDIPFFTWKKKKHRNHKLKAGSPVYSMEGKLLHEISTKAMTVPLLSYEKIIEGDKLASLAFCSSDRKRIDPLINISVSGLVVKQKSKLIGKGEHTKVVLTLTIAGRAHKEFSAPFAAYGVGKLLARMIGLYLDTLREPTSTGSESGTSNEKVVFHETGTSCDERTEDISDDDFKPRKRAVSDSPKKKGNKIVRLSTSSKMKSSPKISRLKTNDLVLKKQGSLPSELRFNADSSISARGNNFDSLVGEILGKKVARSGYEWEICFDEIKFVKKIGVGGFGTVWKGKWQGTDIAVKRMVDLAEYDPAATRRFLREIYFLSKMRHPNIVLFLGASLGLTGGSEERNLCLVTEFCGEGNLMEYLAKHRGSITYARRLELAIDAAKGMLFLHLRKPPMLHRDLKSLNLLIDGGRLKLADFGLAILMEKTHLNGHRTSATTPASLAWLPPEVIANETRTVASDVYSFGMILYELYTEKTPYHNLAHFQIITAITKHNLPPLPSDCPEEYAKLYDMCTREDPLSRPDTHSVLDFLTDLYEKEIAK